MAKRSKRAIPNTVAEILTKGDLQALAARFESHLPEARGAIVVIVCEDDSVWVDGANLGNLETVGALGLAMSMASEEVPGDAD